MRWTVAVGLVIGFMLAPVGQAWWVVAQSHYDEAYPVVRMQAKVVKRDDDSVFVRIHGEKLRACRYVRLQAYAVGDDGFADDVYARRIDMPEKGDNKPLGKFDIGTWQFWPIIGVAVITIYVTHACDGRIVSTKIAEVTA